MEVIINKKPRTSYEMYEGIYNDYYIIKENEPVLAIPKGTWHHSFFAWKLPSTTESKEVWHDFGYNMVDTKPDFSADTLEELQTKIDN
tara:strand:+ start:2955 stop:3218 length:264 start_codon:yes stop_codon:yes gene_type:complete